ncbi:MAG: ATP-dependent sacrificial sulfur transferase LarE [Thermoplasmata archaeon]
MAPSPRSAPAAPPLPGLGPVLDRIRAGGPAVVALSGGVDSALVASLAFEALGMEAHAVTVVGPSVADAEIARAVETARAIGLPHELLPANPLELAEYRANPSNRCFFCRTVEGAALRARGDQQGARQFLDGIHRDDLGEDRPGLRAMEAAGFWHPLLVAGLGKAEVRALARQRGLPHWDAPSDACLASRIAPGQGITADLLGRVAAAEAKIRALGFRQVRVRVRGDSARVEVGTDELARFDSAPLVRSVEAAVKAEGFHSATIDPRGYRGGGART